MDHSYTIQILGNVESCRTEAEIHWAYAEGARKLIAVVFEDAEGWQTCLVDEGTELPESVCDAARDKLSHYVNRLGSELQEGLTVAGLSLWLMLKDDGTAMGRRIEL